MSQVLGRWIALVLIATACLAIASVTLIIDDKVENVLDDQVGHINSRVVERFKLFDGFLYAEEEKMQQYINSVLPELADILLADKPTLLDWSSIELKSLAEHYRVDEIYIIDSNTRVVNTSFLPDLGFELGTISEDLHAYLQSILLQKNIVFHDRFTLSSKTGLVNKYAYFAPANSDYIVEISLEIKPFLAEQRSPAYVDFLFKGLFENRLGNQLFPNTIDLFMVNDLAAIAFDGSRRLMNRSTLPDFKEGEVVSKQSKDARTYYFRLEMSQLMDTKSFEYILIRSTFDLSAVNNLERNLILGIVLVLLFIWLLIYFVIERILRYTVVKRVLKVNKALNAIKDGHYQRQCNVGGADEIRSIAENVNVLAATLGERETQLKLAYDTLDERVKARTVELEEEIEKRQSAESELNQLATTDPLTGLPNRRLIDDYLKRTLMSAHRTKLMTAVLFLDLDNFKIINDSMGHGAGDQVLETIASRLTNSIRGSDVAGRWGGDEFIVLLPDLEGERKIVARHVQTIVEKILELVRADIHIHGYDYQCTVSIGITISNKNSTPETMFREADLAMYKAKEIGKNNFCFYEDIMEDIMQDLADARLLIENDLRTALKHQEFYLHYQPQVNAEQQLLGAEALIRWKKHDGSMVPPATFIPIAEEIGLIHDVGDFVLNASCRQYRTWLDDGLKIPHLAVNLSIKQLERADFVEQLQQTIEQYRIVPSQLYLEITETALWEGHSQIRLNISKLRKHGFKVAMDDFGTGYSSLNNLKQLPIDQLKIDRTFVKGIAQNNDDAAIVGLMISMAVHLGIDLIAEGVENDEEFRFLLKRGCKEFQGYFFSKPLSPEGFADYARQQISSKPISMRSR